MGQPHVSCARQGAGKEERRPKKLQIKKMQHTTKSNKQLDNESTGELEGPRGGRKREEEGESEKRGKFLGAGNAEAVSSATKVHATAN